MIYIFYTLLLLLVSLNIHGMGLSRYALIDKTHNISESLTTILESLSEEEKVAWLEIPEKEKAAFLLAAIDANNIKMVEFLCPMIKSFNAYFENILPLHRAAEKGNKEAVRILLAHGAPINASDPEGHTALTTAVVSANIEMVKLLIILGADSTIIDRRRKSLLHHAWIFAGKEILHLLLNINSRMINHQDKFGKTILMYAAEKGDNSLVERLIELQADVNLKDNLGDTALRKALEQTNIEIVNLLIGAGANVDAEILERVTFNIRVTKEPEKLRGYEQVSNLFTLCNLPEVQEYLKDPIKFAQSKDYVTSSLTTLMLASIFGHVQIISYFKKAEENPEYLNAIDKQGNTAFDLALLYNKKSVIALINTFGNKIDKVKTNKKQQFQQALESEDIQLIIAFLAIGAELDGLKQNPKVITYLDTLPRETFAQLCLWLAKCKGNSQLCRISDSN